MNNKNIVILAGKGYSTNILYNSLKNEFKNLKIIVEEPINKKEFLLKRIKKLGLWQVAGQILFQAVIVKLLNRVSKKRKKEIIKQYQLDDSVLPENIVIPVKSINNEMCLQNLKTLNPDIVIVNGTRIISNKILNCITAEFINMHVGITPKYRGVHGGYWALVNNDKKNFGVTVHVVDSGIDTGKILYQTIISTDKKDNFVTYPYLQLAAGIPFMKKTLAEKLDNKISPEIKSSGQSKLWHHPTIWQYLFYRITKGVK